MADDWSAFPTAVAPVKDEWGAFPAASATPEVPSRIGGALKTASELLPKAVTDIPREALYASRDAWTGAIEGLNPWSEQNRASSARGDLINTNIGKGLLSAAGIPFSPIQGAARSLIGHPLSSMMPTATAEEQERMRKRGVLESMIPKKTAEENYEQAKGGVDTALMALGTRGGLKPVSLPATPPPRPGAPTGDLGVMLSEGQRTGELPLIQREQAALRGQMGDKVQARAQEFADQQRAQVQAATEGVREQFDPFGQVVAETPQEAGAIISESIRRAAAQRKAGVTQAYNEAKALPGEIHAGAFEGMGQKIKGDLSMGENPVIIDDKLTPFASHAIRDVEDRIAKLKIQNRADPFGPPNTENIVGIDLKGVDQMRKRLSAFRRDAFGSGNATDGRATQAIINSFDHHIDAAVNGGLFHGDPRAIQAWNDARAAHADYKSTFTADKNDPIGRVIEKITGKGKNPAAIPNDVADFLYGGTGINPNSLNVGVARRVRDILGEHSPEWSAVKQGLFSRLVEAGPGVTDWGPGKIAQRINKFTRADGIELAHEVFSPQELTVIQQYANLQRRMQVPQAGANWSNTATFVTPLLKKISGSVSGLIGAAMGHIIAPGFGGVAEGASAMGASKIASAISGRKELNQIRKQMPLLSETLQKWQQAAMAVNRTNAPLTQKAMNVASANLARSLEGMGINPQTLMQTQGAVPAAANEQQQ